jgi:hypothetical protein
VLHFGALFEVLRIHTVALCVGMYHDM